MMLGGIILSSPDQCEKNVGILSDIEVNVLCSYLVDTLCVYYVDLLGLSSFVCWWMSWF